MAYICFPGWHCNTIFCFPVELWLHVCKCQKLSPTQTDLLVFNVNEWSESLDTRGLWYLRDPPLDWLKCRTLGIVYIWCNYPQAFDEEFSRRFQLPTRLSSPRFFDGQFYGLLQCSPFCLVIFSQAQLAQTSVHLYTEKYCSAAKKVTMYFVLSKENYKTDKRAIRAHARPLWLA